MMASDEKCLWSLSFLDGKSKLNIYTDDVHNNNMATPNARKI